MTQIEFLKDFRHYKQEQVINVDDGVADVLIKLSVAKKHTPKAQPKKRGRPRKNTYQTRVLRAEDNVAV